MVKSKKIKKMIWTHGWVVFPVITGRPLHYYWKGNKFQTEVVKKIIALDANHIVVECRYSPDYFRCSRRRRKDLLYTVFCR